MKRIIYFDLVGGASGDMLLGALADAGAEEELIRTSVAQVIGGISIEGMLVNPAGLRARKLSVSVAHESHEHRPYRVVRDLIQRSELGAEVKGYALEAFRRLAEAEGHVHGVDPEQVEFHEVGSDDAIADIVGVSAALVSLKPEEVVSSPVPLGRGLTHSAHGPIPLPGPAVLELLKGIPVEGVPLEGETVTPTGAALLASIVTRFGLAPRMIVDQIGVGAGTRAWADRPNVIRALVGRTVEAQETISHEDCIVEANLDDMTPEHASALTRELFVAGALDVWTQPITMKKGRLGFLVCALARQTIKEAIAGVFFAHSTTLGVRLYPVDRIRSERRMEQVQTQYGIVRIKVAFRPGQPELIAPEYDDCERLAEEAGVSVRAVHEAALFEAWRERASRVDAGAKPAR